MRSWTLLARVGVVLALLAPAAGGAAAIDFYEADFLLADAARPPDGTAAWQRLSLPDDWRRTRPHYSGGGWYRLRVVLAAPGEELHALYVPRAGDQLEVFVNGVRVGRSGGADDPPVRTWKRPQLYTIPPALLRPGENRIDVRLLGRSGNQSGLSPLRFGLEEELRGAYWRRFALQTVGPVALAAALGLVGVFFLALWSRRREDTMYALFASASLLWGARNVIDLFFYRALPPPHWEIWLALLYQGFAALLCLFALRFVGTRLPRYERLLIASLPLSLLAYYALLPLVPAPQTTRAGLLFAIVMAAVPAAVIGRAALRRGGAATVLMAVVGLFSLGFGLYDWFAALSPQMYDSIRLMPYLALFFTTTAGWLLIHRFVTAYAGLERMNAELDRRVAEKSAELRANLEQLEQARARAEEANRAKSRFLAAASHDLRQPLHALALFAATLRGEITLPQARTVADNIGRCVGELEKMFGELMDVSRLEVGTVAVAPCAFALQEVFDRLYADFQPLAAQKGLWLRLRPSREWALSDPLMFERILRNLLSNAIRYTERGGVLVACRRRGGMLRLEVRDSGIGIAAAEQERIFEEFYQVGNPERDRKKGSGLGLAIVRRLAELLGSRIELRSAPGRGACFAFQVPRVLAVADGGGEPARARPLAAALRVAVLEDDVLAREALVRLLTAQGAHVVAAAGAAQLLERLAGSGAPDVLVADYQLCDGENGVAAAHALRARYGADLPVILLTGQSGEHLAQARASGFPLLQKPVPGGRLIALLQAVLSPALHET